MNLKNAFRVVGFASTLIFTSSLFFACSGDNGVDGKNGKDGKDAAEVDVDSLANSIREEITGSLWDTLYSKPYVDTVYNALFDNAFASAWMDSVREALIDSLKKADYDSLYAKLYDSVYADIYTQSVIRTLTGFTYTSKEDINGAFANQYSLMYKDYVGTSGSIHPVPVSIKVQNECESADVADAAYIDEDLLASLGLDNMTSPTVPCRWKKIMVKSWIENYTDTGTVTGFVNPDTSEIFAPSLHFNKSALLELTAPEETQIQIRAYALENDHEILFYSSSEPTTIHPMQVNGGEYAGVANRSLWRAVWVTPNMDSITSIHQELEKKLPDGAVKAYQLYSDDSTMLQSSTRLVKAVYEVLSAKGINYVNNTDAGSIGQKIKYPIEVLRTGQANCIEGTYLFASILESLGMHTYIIIIPGHAFLGWATDDEKTNFNFLETTMAWGDSPSTFAKAYAKGNTEFEEQQDAGNFSDGTSEQVSIDDARDYGVMPNDIP